MKFLDKTIEYGLYLLIFVLPWQTRLIVKAGEIDGGYFEYGTVSLYATDLLLISLLGLFLFWRIKIGKLGNWEIGKLGKFMIAGLCLMLLVSVFLAPDKIVATQSFLRFLLGVGLFWMIISASYSRVKLIYSFLAGAALQAGLGLWQFFMQGAFACKWLGMAGHQPSDLGHSVMETISGGRWLRAYGGFDHPNIFGGVMAVGVLLIILEIARKDFVIKKRAERIMLSVMAILLAAGLFVSFSRAAWLAFVVGLAVIALIAIIKKEKDALKNIFKISAVCAVVFLIFGSVYSELLFTRLGSNARLEAKSNVERVESLVGAGDVIRNNWLLGVGVGNYTQELEIRNLKLEIGKFAWEYQPAHDVFLLVWAEAGVLGLLFFVGVLVFTGYEIFKKNIFLYSISLIAALLPMMMVDHWIWSLHFGVLFFWVMMGVEDN